MRGGNVVEIWRANLPNIGLLHRARFSHVTRFFNKSLSTSKFTLVLIFAITNQQHKGHWKRWSQNVRTWRKSAPIQFVHQKSRQIAELCSVASRISTFDSTSYVFSWRQYLHFICTRAHKATSFKHSHLLPSLDFFSVALQSLKDVGLLTYRKFLELFRHMVGLLGRVISPSQSLYLHRTTQHRETRTNIHALSGIRTHDPSNQPAKTHAPDRMATVTGSLDIT
jgi:hypothetical protein